ncbi:MAG: hypothetical protein HC927_03970, partial [Deltaproteobacteria bacterium]|nr:hypothetical protein [Deltaproteobacteria bacterium]
GRLSASLAQHYEQVCGKAIARPSRAKALVRRHAMTLFVDHGLYRSRLLRGILRWGYAHGALEQTKIV